MSKKSEPNRNKIPPIGWVELIAGAMLVLFGASLVNDPVVSFKGGVEADISPFNVPAAAVSLGIGLYLLWNSMSKTVPDEATCPKCGEVFSSDDTSVGNCPSCGSKLRK